MTQMTRFSLPTVVCHAPGALIAPRPHWYGTPGSIAPYVAVEPSVAEPLQRVASQPAPLQRVASQPVVLQRVASQSSPLQRVADVLVEDQRVASWLSDDQRVALDQSAGATVSSACA